MDDLVRLTMLYDFYGALLTSKQRYIFEMYYMENNSIVEIAESLTTSRQAVSDLLIRVKYRLFDYEEKVGYAAFYEEHRKMRERVLAEPGISDEIRAMLAK